jgi:vacuolar-type H+-ATPase subunit E/Vma4
MDSQELEKFKVILKGEYERRVREYEQKIEEELAEIAASKMLELERKMEEIRKSRSKTLQERLDFLKLKAVKSGKDIIINEANTLFLDIENTAKQITCNAKVNPANYSRMLNELIKEAVKVLSSESGIIWLPPDDKDLLASIPKGFSLSIIENLESWGGPIVTDDEFCCDHSQDGR